MQYAGLAAGRDVRPARRGGRAQRNAAALHARHHPAQPEPQRRSRRQPRKGRRRQGRSFRTLPGLGILYAYYLEQPDKGLEQLQKALDNPNTPADLKKAVAEEVTKIKEHKKPHASAGAVTSIKIKRPGLLPRGVPAFSFMKGTRGEAIDGQRKRLAAGNATGHG